MDAGLKEAQQTSRGVRAAMPNETKVLSTVESNKSFRFLVN